MQLITPPVGPVVSLQDLRDQLNVEGAYDDTVIVGLEAAAVAYLDGWGGVLGRAIKPQTWRWEVSQWGLHRLPLPDVTAVSVTYLDAAGDEQPATTAILSQDVAGSLVEIDGPAADRIFINMTAALGAQKLPAVEMIVKLIVAAWYDDRTAPVPTAAHSLITAMRWARI